MKPASLLVGILLIVTGLKAQPDYVLDPGFNPHHLFTISLNGVFDFYVHQDGKIFALGYIDYNGIDGISAGRIYSNGLPDPSWDPHPIQTGSNTQVTFVPDSNYYILSGLIGNCFRMNYDGGSLFSLSDTDANNNYSLEAWECIYSIQNYQSEYHWDNQSFWGTRLVANNKLLLYGNFETDTVQEPESERLLMRLLPNGRMDSSLVPVKADPYRHYDAIERLFPAPNGKWIVGGIFDGIGGWNTINVARLNADFTVDTTFTSPFSVNDILHNGGTGVDYVDSLGRIYVSNETNYYQPNADPLEPQDSIQFCRLLPNGAVDSSFQITFLQNSYLDQGVGDIPVVVRMIPTDHHTFILCGQFTGYNGQARQDLAEVDTNGTLLPTFSNFSIRFYLNNNPDNFGSPVIGKVQLLPDGDLLLAGEFTQIDSTERWCMAKLKPVDTGVQEVKEISVKIGPNPANTRLQITFPDGKYAHSHAVFYDLSGRQIAVPQLMGGSMQWYDVSSLATGIYLAGIMQDGKRLKTVKVVVAH